MTRSAIAFSGGAHASRVLVSASRRNELGLYLTEPDSCNVKGSSRSRGHDVAQAELSWLSQIDADVSEIGTRAGEADSRMYKPLQNAFGA
jgi:hypothetical protein